MTQNVKIIPGETILLTQGYAAYVDPEDYERISKRRWCAQVARPGYVRAVRGGPKGMIYMSHEVLGITPKDLNGKVVDHIDGNPLNNRKSNLRIVILNTNAKNTHRHREAINRASNSNQRPHSDLAQVGD